MAARPPKQFGTNKQLPARDFFDRLAPQDALAILDAHESALQPWLETARPGFVRGEPPYRSLVRRKLQRIEKLRCYLKSKASADSSVC